MLVLYDLDTLLHETVELLGSKIKPALESPARIQVVIEKLSEGSEHSLEPIESPLKKKDTSNINSLLGLIRQTHEEAYVEHLENAFDQWHAAGLIAPHESILPECFVFPTKAHAVPRLPKDIFAQAGCFAFDMSSGIMCHTYTSAIASANLAAQAVRHLSDNQRTQPPSLNIFALCRPPGHHCDGHRAGGYCYINNAAVCISTYRSLSKNSDSSRIGILDLDFHHGNGTQEIFYSDPHVFYASVHGEDEFPYYTGSVSETGADDAVGTKLNFPLPAGSTFTAYMEKVEQALESLSSTNFDPELLVVSLGFDTFNLDPLGSFQIETGDYEVLAGRVRGRLRGVPAVILLEGGYVLEHLGENVSSFLRGWEAGA